MPLWRIGGIVLCGGRSVRMGQPKAWLPLGGELLLQRVVRVLREVVDPVVVVAAPGQDVPPLGADVAIVRDEHEGRGPLQGFVTGMDALHGRCDAVYLSGCDTPLLTAPFVRRVIRELQDSHETHIEAVAPRIDGQRHPLAAAYSLALLPRLAAYLRAGHRRMTDVFQLAPSRDLDRQAFRESDPDLISLMNLNTPGDYDRCRTELLKPPRSR